MAQHSDPFPPALAHRAASPDMEAQLTRVLEHHGDEDGTIARSDDLPPEDHTGTT